MPDAWWVPSDGSSFPGHCQLSEITVEIQANMLARLMTPLKVSAPTAKETPPV